MAAPQGTELGLFIAASSGGVQLSPESMGDLALNLLRTVPQARLAVLEHFNAVFSDYVCNCALHARAVQFEPARKALAGLIARLSATLDQLMPTAPAGFADDVCRWSLDLLASLCSKYAPHVLGDSYSMQRNREDRPAMEDRTRQWLSVPGIQELLDIAERYGSRDAFADGLLAGQPQLDWLLAASRSPPTAGGGGAASASLAVLDRLLTRAIQPTDSGGGGAGSLQPSLLDLLSHLAINRRAELSLALRRLCQIFVDSSKQSNRPAVKEEAIQADDRRRRLGWFLLQLAGSGSAALSGLLVELAVEYAASPTVTLADSVRLLLAGSGEKSGVVVERRQLAASVLLRCQEPPALSMLRLLLPAARRSGGGECSAILACLSAVALRSLPGYSLPQSPQPAPVQDQTVLRFADCLTGGCRYSARLLAAAAVVGRRPRCMQRLLRLATVGGRPKLLLQALDVIELHDSDASDAIADGLIQRLQMASDWRVRRRLVRSARALLVEEASLDRRRLAAAVGRRLPRLLRLLDAGPGPADTQELLALISRLDFHRSASLAECLAATGALARAATRCLLESGEADAGLAQQLIEQLLRAACLFPHCRVAAIRQIVQAMLAPLSSTSGFAADTNLVSGSGSGSVALITQRPPNVDVAGQLLRRRAPPSAAQQLAKSTMLAAQRRWSAEQDLLALLHRLVIDGDAARCSGSGGSQSAARVLAVALSQAACPEGSLLALAATLDKVGLESGTRVLSQFRARPVALWGALELAATLGEPCVLAHAAPLLAALLTGLTVHWCSRRQQPQSSACAGAAAETCRLISLLRANRLLSPPLDRLDAIVDCLTPAELHPLLEELRRAVLEAAARARREGPLSVAAVGLVSAERAAPLLNRLLHRHVERLAPLFGEFFGFGGGPV